MKKILLLFIPLFLASFFGQAVSAKLEPFKRYRFENEQLRITLLPRTPEQIAAFYEGRKFPAHMIERLKQACFFTVGITNKSRNILWLELDNWAFSSSDQAIKRYHRNEWPPLWKNMQITMASQSTFRWTLLPEKLDFRPEEREGGNIILERTDTAFTVTAHFRSAGQSSNSPVPVKIENVRCAQ